MAPARRVGPRVRPGAPVATALVVVVALLMWNSQSYGILVAGGKQNQQQESLTLGEKLHMERMGVESAPSLLETAEEISKVHDTAPGASNASEQGGSEEEAEGNLQPSSSAPWKKAKKKKSELTTTISGSLQTLRAEGGEVLSAASSIVDELVSKIDQAGADALIAPKIEFEKTQMNTGLQKLAKLEEAWVQETLSRKGRGGKGKGKKQPIKINLDSGKKISKTAGLMRPNKTEEMTRMKIEEAGRGEQEPDLLVDRGAENATSKEDAQNARFSSSELAETLESVASNAGDLPDEVAEIKAAAEKAEPTEQPQHPDLGDLREEMRKMDEMRRELLEQEGEANEQAGDENTLYEETVESQKHSHDASTALLEEAKEAMELPSSYAVGRIAKLKGVDAIELIPSAPAAPATVAAEEQGAEVKGEWEGPPSLAQARSNFKLIEIPARSVIDKQTISAIVTEQLLLGIAIAVGIMLLAVVGYLLACKKAGRSCKWPKVCGAPCGSCGSARRSASPAGSQLPEGWTLHYSDAGIPYYHNANTGRSVWELPRATTTTAANSSPGSPMVGVPGRR